MANSILDFFPNVPLRAMDENFEYHAVERSKVPLEKVQAATDKGWLLLIISDVSLKEEFEDSNKLVPVKMDAASDKEVHDRLFKSGENAYTMAIIDPQRGDFSNLFTLMTRQDCDILLIGETTDELVQNKIDQAMTNSCLIGVVTAQIRIK